MGQEKSGSYVGMGQGEVCLVSQDERGKNRSGARRGGRTTGVREHRLPEQTHYSEAGGSGTRVLTVMSHFHNLVTPVTLH